MCGIAGIFAYRENAPPVDPEELLRIREAMRPRGPDGAGLWLDEEKRIGLGHRRLSIIDLSDAGHQPMISADGRLAVVFNGELYNHRDLRTDLERGGQRFRSNSDTEVLLHLYARKGRAMVHDLRGMYAFALWDEARRGLFLARDPFGIKPLYYADDGSTLRIASQVKALLKGGRIDTTPEPAGHIGFFLWGYVPEPYTLYKGIRSLPPGSTLWLEASGVRETHSFCDLSEELVDAGESPPQMNPRTRREYLREALLDTVRCHLIADVPVGVFLSSGLDSTTLTALASEETTESLRTVTLGFDAYRGTPEDETLPAKTVAAHYRTAHRTLWVSKEDFFEEMDAFINAMDQPTVDGVNTYFVSKVTAQTGLKTALSGLGGDELFGGYNSFREIPDLVGVLSRLPFADHLGDPFRLISAPVLKHFTSPKYAGLLKYGSNYSGAYLLRRGLFMPWELPDLLDGEMVREGWREFDSLVHMENSISEMKTAHLKVSILETTRYMRNQLLRDTDWTSMAHSLEVRVPLVDMALLRKIAPFMSTPSPFNKKEMAQTPARPLPDAVKNRPKSGFVVPVRDWLMNRDGEKKPESGWRGWAREVYRMYQNID